MSESISQLGWRIILFCNAYVVIAFSSCGERTSSTKDIAPRNDVKEYHSYVEFLQNNLVLDSVKPSDSSVIYFLRVNDTMRVGKAYKFVNNHLRKGFTYNLDTAVNEVKIYGNDGEVNEVRVGRYDHLANKFVLAEYCYLNSEEPHHCLILDFHIPSDTLYLDISDSIAVEFSMSPFLRDSLLNIKYHSINYNHYGRNPISTSIKEVSINSPVIKVKPEQYGYLTLNFELLVTRYRTLFMKRVLYIVPTEFENYDWSFLDPLYRL